MTSGLYQRPQPTRLDPLTQLPNRVGLRGALEDQGAESATLALVELTSLSKINAEHGCLEGDRLLRYFSSRLCQGLPESTAGRWGGNAFLVIFPDTNQARASLTLKEALGPLVSEPYQTLSRTPAQVSVAAGLVEIDLSGQVLGVTPSLDEVLAEVDLLSV